jgi:hypothetical protein
MLTKVSKDHKLTQGLAYIFCLFVYFLSSLKKRGREGSANGGDISFVGTN